jgi:hypothetical protein
MWALAAVSAHAANIDVDRLDDPTPIPSTCNNATANDCSLRGAIKKANANGADDTIRLTLPGTYVLSLAGSDDTADAGDLDILPDTTAGPVHHTLTINNTSGGTVIIQQTAVGERVFDLLANSNLTMSRVTVTGGNLPNASGVHGAGFRLTGAATLTMSRSTITGNSIAAGGNGTSGGAIRVNSVGGTVNLTNVTISNNSANYSAAIYNEVTSSVTMQNVTITKNISFVNLTERGAIHNRGTMTIRNSIVGDNTLGSCHWFASTGTETGTNNLTDDSACVATGTGFTVGTLGLGALANNGGDSDTHAINSSSSGALDAGDNTTCPSTDQRGINRPASAGNPCDIGSYERRRVRVNTTAGTTTFMENDPPVVVDPTVTVTSDDGNITSAFVDINAGYVSGEDVLQFVNTPPITATFNPVNGRLTFSGSDTAANYQAAFQSVKYANSSDNPTAGPRTIRFRASDGVTTDQGNRTLTVTAVNDAPVITLPNQTADEDVQTTLTGISIADPDVGSGSMALQVQVASGTMTMPMPAGGTIAGSGTSTINATGTPSALNAALGSLTFTTVLNQTSNVMITIDVNDNANSPTPAKTDNKSATINVNAVNDPPVLTVLSPQNPSEDTPLPLPPITVADVDAGSGSLSVTITCSHCTLAITSGPPPTVVGNDSNNVSLNGTLADLNTALASVVYKGVLNYTGPDTIVVSVNDQGNTPGPPLSDTENIPVVVGPINDPPVNTLKPPADTLHASQSGYILNLPSDLARINDVDAGNGPFEVTISMSVGTMTLTTKAGLTFLDNTDGNDDSTIKFRGSKPQVNNALGSLKYTVPAGYAGPSTFSITTDDLGATGCCGPQTDTDAVPLQIVAGNDPPVNSVPLTSPTSAIQVKKNTPFTMNAANNALVSTGDVDADPGQVRVQLNVGKGTLTLATTAGLTFEAGDGTADALMRFKGTLASVNAAMNGMVYTPNLNALDNTTLVILTNDLGNTGAGGAKQDQDTVYLKIVP